MSKILVTGGAGFIGGHLVDALVAQGHEVRVLDPLVPQVHRGKPDYLNPKAEYVFRDVREKEHLQAALKDVEVLYHLAAAVGVGQSMYQIEDYVQANTGATATLLQLLVQGGHRVQRLVVASSMSIYGEGLYRCESCGVQNPPLRSADQMQRKQWEMICAKCGQVMRPAPTPESKPLEPTSIYAISKQDQEEMSLVVGRAYGIPTVALRFFNVYGPRQALSNPYTGVAAIFQSRIQNGQPPLIFEDGEQSRDFISVHDVVQGLLLAGRSPAANYRAINLGTGRPTPIRRVAELLLEMYGLKATPQVTGEYRAGDIRHCVADTSLATALLGFQAKVPLEEGLKEFLAWSRTQRPEDRVPSAYQELARHGLVRSGA